MEPATSAKVVLHTSKGPIELELWARETPLACRNFVQHCLNGYYDGCTFHRVVKDFIVQAGDPTGTGDGGQAIYEGGVFKDEIHSRLKFNRRGLVGCASTARNHNGSQFLITLAPAPELTGKATLFGRVVGDSLFNVLAIGEAEVDDERPLYPTIISRTEVVIPYFTDLVQANKSAPIQQKSIPRPEKKRVKLMYDEEEEDEVKIKPARAVRSVQTGRTEQPKPSQDLKQMSKRDESESKRDESESKRDESESKRDESDKEQEQAVETMSTDEKQVITDKQERDRQTMNKLKAFQAQLDTLVDEWEDDEINLNDDDESE